MNDWRYAAFACWHELTSIEAKRTLQKIWKDSIPYSLYFIGDLARHGPLPRHVSSTDWQLCSNVETVVFPINALSPWEQCLSILFLAHSQDGGRRRFGLSITGTSRGRRCHSGAFSRGSSQDFTISVMACGPFRPI